jgi:hypothetical protein
MTPPPSAFGWPWSVSPHADLNPCLRTIADGDHPQVLPIEDMEKAKLLPVKSPLLRLRLVVHWIEQLNSNWFVEPTYPMECAVRSLVLT